jgi:signal transduction histidine kinase
MAHDLQLRLILTYGGVTLAALLLLGSVFTAVLATSVSSAHVHDMQAETSALAAQLDRAFAHGARRQAIQRLIRHDSALLGKRIILLDRQGHARYDSAHWTRFSRGSWRMVDLAALRHGRWARLQGGGRFGLQSPLLVHGREVGAVALVVTSADTGIPWAEILPRLLGVLSALLLAWLVIAISLARSLSRPLRHVSAGLMRVKDGEYDRPVPERGWSEARSLARRYNEMVAEVARSRQLQRDFVANAAHELKTPVALVAGFARSLADGTAQRDGAVDDAVKYIRIESEHLARVVDQLFALASLDADTEALSCVPCRPDGILRQTVIRFGEQALARGKFITVECGPDIPTCLWDEERVASALTNLITNALEHAGSSETVVARVARAGGAVVIEVEDSGDGIASDDLPHIFDRFYRGRGRRVDGHAGLGLALVHEIVERHGGVVRVQSRVGKGTRFTLTLPIEAPNHSTDLVDTSANQDKPA